MRVRDIMVAPVASCGPATNLAAVAAILWRNDCGVVPVVGEGGTLLGILTDRDVCIAVGTSNRRASEITAAEVMTKKLHTCRPDDDVSLAIDAISAGRVRRVPVVEHSGKLIGIVSINDLILRTGEPGGAVAEPRVMGALRAICAHEQTVKQAHSAGSK